MAYQSSVEERRRKAVQQEEGSNALEGIKPSPELKDLTEKYIRGEITIAQALKKTREQFGYEP